MLKIVLGRAGSGKTTLVMEDFKTKKKAGMTKLFFIVPEQYSHDAERQLLKACGDSLSLHGEVLSFSRLGSRVLAETGGLGATLLDDGGRILMMSRAFSAVSGKLRMYGRTEQKTDFLERLVALSKEFKAACITPEDLACTAEAASGPLKEKLRDLSLITGAFDACFDRDRANPDDRLNSLTEAVAQSDLFCGGHLYFDGFTDFTAQELRVIEALLRKGADMTVCLTCDGLSGQEEIFEPARTTARKLLRMASSAGAMQEVVTIEAAATGKAKALEFLEKNLFLYNSETCDCEHSGIEVFRAATPDLECEYAASRVLQLLRQGYRLMDITVAVCDWEAQGTLAENIFEKYGVPIFVSRKADICAKPPVALIEKALEIVSGGWEYDAVFAYLKTGLSGVSPDDLDRLENYVLQWNLKGTIWTREEDWTFPPDGYEPDHRGDSGIRLKEINRTRRAVMLPLRALQRALKASATFGGKVRAVYDFLEDIGLPERITQKSEAFLKKGELQLSDEYAQLWEILVRAFEQFYEISGDATGSTAEFARLWKLLISQYDMGSIPVALDRVALGELSRIRRRGCKCLIVVGATDEALPKTGGRDSLLSDGERRDILNLGLTIQGSAEDRLYRALNTVYSALTIPSDKLIVTYPKTSSVGGETRSSFVIRRLKAVFSVQEQSDADFTFRLLALNPAFELASAKNSDPKNLYSAAADELLRTIPSYVQKLKAIDTAAGQVRGRLSGPKSAQLYGHSPVMSASRIDKYYACRFLYFLQYGLNARPRKPAGFDAPTAGTFLHYILENVARDIRDGAGFNDVGENDCLALTRKYVDLYVEKMLDGFKDKTSRFKYLFNRLVRDASFIVADMVRELQKSDFRPLDFELEFSEGGGVPPYEISGRDAGVKIKGFVDRVDGWTHDGKLYLRVVDYKTGKKSFSLSDVLHGLNMQMLIYLFALQKNGSEKFGDEIVPAGVLYAPAREEIVQSSRNACAEEIEDARARKLRRSGMLLSDGAVIEAMEHGTDKKYLPVKMSADVPAGESLANAVQLGALSVHIDKMLLEIAGNVKRGCIQAEPYYKNQNENACLCCDYAEACRFDETAGDRRRYMRKIKTDDAWKIIMEEAGE